METAFLLCAVLGGTLVVCQMLASVFGMMGDTDSDTDHDDAHHDNFFLGMLTVRTVSSALLFFGLGGLTSLYYGADEPAAFGVAIGAGLAALYLVATLMKSVAKLKADGTARVERAIGRPGTVYLRIPAGRSAAGKIQMMLQNRTVEYQAVTAGNELPTGTAIKVVAIVNSDTVEVEAV